MKYFLQFRRCILLLLSLTLSAQAMAVASLGSCHRIKALTALTAMQSSVAPAAHHHADSVAPHHADSAAQHASGTQPANSSDTAPAGNDGRQSCAACAACHLSSLILNTEIALTDIPAAGATSFPESAVPRIRNVASGLERPPRT